MALTISANVKQQNPSIDTTGVAFMDIYLDSQGNISMSYDLQAVLQACAEAAQTILGEMVFNIDQGIPYFQTVWVGVPNIPQVIASLRTAFLLVGGGGLVLEVVSLITDIDAATNQLVYSAVIRTIYGTGSFNG